MKRFLLTITICSVLVIGTCFGPSAFAGEQTWTFDGNAADWTVANGAWEVQDGAYQVTKGEPAMHTLVGDASWTDYTLEAKVRIDDGNWAGLVVRAQNEFEYYVYYMNVPDNKSELWKHNAGAFDARENLSQIPAVNVTIANGEWFDVAVVAAGDTLQLWINGELQSEATDAAYAAGQVGIWAWDTTASFDDVKVSGDGIAGTTTSVQPQGKLATKWARLKRDR